MPTEEIVRWTEVSNFEGTNFSAFDENPNKLRELSKLIEGLGFTTKSSRVWAYEKALADVQKPASVARMSVSDMREFISLRM